MKLNQWTLTLAAAGVVSIASVALAEEAQHQVQTALSSTTLSGYVDTSAIWQFGNGKTSTGRSYDGADKQNGFNLNVVKLTLEKPLDEGQWSAGYKVDLLAGPDANKIGVGSVASTSDFAVQQAYIDLRVPVGNGLDFKMGQFSTIVGYESFDAAKNPNYSRSYGYAIEPFSHTGVLASYQVVDWLSLCAGVANTWSQQINGRSADENGTSAESQKTYMGGFTLTAPESMGFLKGAQLYAGIVDGLSNGKVTSSVTPAAEASDITSYYVGATVPTPLTGLSVGASYDYRGTKEKNDGTFYNSTYANATALYLKYKATEKLSFADRVEYATGTLGSWNTTTPTSAESDKFFANTFTVDYSLWANVITRAEFRWDHDLSGSRSAFATDSGAGSFANNALSLALNVIYQF
jgi:hypothetical protein